ncbi:hypothetical protein A2U01_0004918, partial [Trifolium medium]|nr:hypothetical protein [Trifolium medium]
TEQNGTPPNPSELFIHTHKHRKNGTWVDRRSEHVHGKYKLRSEQLTQEASLQGNAPPKDLDASDNDDGAGDNNDEDDDGDHDEELHGE